MMNDWQDLTRLTGTASLRIERVRLQESGISIEGDFELPPLAGLLAEDQVFVTAFIRCHGSIKEMEQLFGISYPTVKSRLNRIGAQLPFAEVHSEPRPSASDILDQLERGEISARDAIARLEEGQK